MIKIQILKSVIFLFVLFVVLFFSTYHIKESPSVWYDEGIYIQTAANVVAGEGLTFQFAPDHLVNMMSKFTVGYPLIYILASFFKIFDTNILVARSVMVVWLLAFVILSFILVKKRYGVNMAMCAMALVATFPPFYGNGKSVLGEVPALVFLALSLIFFRKAFTLENQRRVWIIIAAFLAGLAVATKLIFLLYVPVFAIAVVWMWRKKLLDIVDVILTVVFSSLPIALWLFLQYRFESSLATILNFYANPSGVVSLLTVFRDNIINFFTEAGPAYLFIMMIVWLASVIIRKKVKISIPYEEIMALCFSVLVCLAYLRIVGWHRYIFPAQMVALIYFIPSLFICIKCFGDNITARWPAFNVNILRTVVPVILFVLVVWGLHGLLFNSWVASAYSSHKTEFWENYFKNTPVEQSFFFYDAPEVVIFIPHHNYYQYVMLLPVGGPFGSEWLEVIDRGIVDHIIIRSDFFEDRKVGFLKNYHIALKAYKYTILDRNARK